MAIFKIPALLLIKCWTFSHTARLYMSLYTRVIHF